MPANFGEAPRQVEQEFVNLPSLISDELGISRSIARMEIAMGTVEIDGEESKEKFDFKRSDLAGKTVVVFGERRQFKVTVPAE